MLILFWQTDDAPTEEVGSPGSVSALRGSNKPIHLPTFTVTPGESLKRINSRLSNFYAIEYEKGTLEVHVQRGTHQITVRLSETNLPYVTAPGPRQSWNNDYFPDVVRFLFDRPIRTANFPYDQFTLNSVAVNSGDIEIDDQFSFAVYLTGTTVTDALVTGNNNLALAGPVRGERGGELLGSLWNGELVDDVLPRRGQDSSYSYLGGKLQLKRIVLHKNSTSATELSRFTKRKNVKILDYKLIETAPSSSIGGWLYVLYHDTETFEIEYIDPSRDSVIQETGTTIDLKFTRAIDPQFKTDFISRISTTNYQDTGLTAASAISWSTTNDLITITPDATTQTQGLHQIFIDMDGVYAVDGQPYASPNKRVWSTYYLKNVTFPKNLGDLLDVDFTTTPPSDGEGIVYSSSTDEWTPGSVGGGGGGGAPTSGPYITYASNGTLTAERIISGHTYLTTSNDGTNLVLDVDTTALEAVFATVDDVTGHSGATGIHFTEPNINHINIANVGTYTHATIDTTLDELTGHTGDVTSNPHDVDASDVGSPTLAVYNALVDDVTGHSGDATIHFTEASIGHHIITGIGTNDHATIDTHLASTSNPHSVTALQVSAPDLTTYNALVDDVTGHSGDVTIHYTVGSIDHTLLDGSTIGTNTHGQIDTAIEDLTGHTGDVTSNPHVVTAVQISAQPLDAGLTSIAGLTTVANQYLYTTALDTYETGSLTSYTRTLLEKSTQLEIQTYLFVVPGTHVQPYSASLSSINNLVTVADQFIYTTASDTYETGSITSFARGLIDDASALAMSQTLDLEIGVDVQAWHDNLDQFSTLANVKNEVPYFSGTSLMGTFTSTSFTQGFMGGSSALDLQTTMSVIPGTDVQAYDATLQALATVSTESSGDSFLYGVDEAGWHLKGSTTTAADSESGKFVRLNSQGQLDKSFIGTSAEGSLPVVNSAGFLTSVDIDSINGQVLIENTAVDGGVEFGLIGQDSLELGPATGTGQSVEYTQWSEVIYGTWIFTNNHATAAGATRIGMVDTTNFSTRVQIPSGYECKILACYGTARSGSTAGTYTVNMGAYVSAALVEYATASTSSTTALFYISAVGTLDSPVASIDAGDWVQLYWENDATSPGALSSTHHIVQILYALVPV